MGKTNPTVVAFNGGEGDKETLARVDLDIYSRLAETLQNAFPYTQGKISKVPGSKFLDDVTALAVVTEEDGDSILDEAGAEVTTEGESLAVLRPFVRSGEIAYVLEFSANQIRFIDNTTEDYVMIDGAAATIGAWSDQSAAPPSGGGAPIEPGSGGVGDPFFVDIDYDWIATTEGGQQVILP